MATGRFVDYLDRDAQNQGLALRFTFTPHPLVGNYSHLRQYLEGNNPLTGRPIMESILDALTRPVPPPSEHKPEGPKARRPRLLEPDTEENLQRLFIENGWTDGLPIVLPTEERVAEMLRGTSHPPDEVVGRMTITTLQEKLEYTVEKVAVNAVMAGARPEHFPVILALASTEEPSMPSSTTSFARMMVVNGPIRHEIGMNCGVGALSPFNLANAVIGRAWTLLTINLGDARLGETFMGSQGNNTNYNNMCCAENEERSVWDPFHVEKGFRADESVVSVFRGWSVINSLGAPNKRGAHEESAMFMKCFTAIRSSATLVMDPLVAKGLKENHGFKTKEELRRWLSENVKITAKQYWDTDINRAFFITEAEHGVEPYASWYKLLPDELFTPYSQDPQNINFVVVGGETNPLWQTTDLWYVKSASVDKWRPKKPIPAQARMPLPPVDILCSDGSCSVPTPGDGSSCADGSCESPPPKTK
jgi:hypothetical protein